MIKTYTNLLVLLLCVSVCISIPYQMKYLKPLMKPQHEEEIGHINKNVIIDEALQIKVDEFAKVQSNKTTSNILWPQPKLFQHTIDGATLKISPCRINYKIISPQPQLIQQIVDIYLTQVFQCKQQPLQNITLVITVKSTTQLIATTTLQQKYALYVRTNNSKWQLTSDYYSGFLRGFQTFSQLFQQSINEQDEKQYSIQHVPIVIEDQPDYIWRGLMIDSSRHFQPVEIIKKMIDGMMFNKMNILHWHITDQDSFPLEINNFPELADYGKIGGTYSEKDVKVLIQYAKTRGVRLIPEIDTPAHTESWGRSPGLKDIVVNCNGEYQGQFDPTLNLTYDTVKRVMSYINLTFIDKYVHFGGDQISMKCFDKIDGIQQRMKQLNISDYKQLQIYYRQKQKKLWRQLNPTKKAIYWANEQIDLPLQNDDVIHWWGVSKNINQLKGRKNEVILSNYDLAYLDVGFGNRYGNSYGVYENWRNLYQQFTTKIDGVNVIGGVVCMWSQIANPYNIQTKVWIRSSAMAEKLWNSNIPTSGLTNIAKRLHAQSQRMRSRGFKVSPVTVGLCEKDMEICFG